MRGWTMTLHFPVRTAKAYLDSLLVSDVWAESLFSLVAKRAYLLRACARSDIKNHWGPPDAAWCSGSKPKENNLDV